jgi:hypothetical protein
MTAPHRLRLNAFLLPLEPPGRALLFICIQSLALLRGRLPLSACIAIGLLA